MKYKQLASKARYQISYLKHIGLNKKVIVQTLKRHVSTIYCELKRNKDHQGYYYYNKAYKFAVVRSDNRTMVSEPYA